jgi:phospholipase C
MRRLALGAPLLLLLAACGDDEVLRSIGTEGWDRPVTPPTDVEAAQARAACNYQAGALPEETQGASTPSGDAVPVDHIVVVMQENRSFDHYFQKLPEYGQPDVEVAPADFSNPDKDENPVGIFHETRFCTASTNHTWAGCHQQYDDGMMDGFVATNEGVTEDPGIDPSYLDGRRAMGYYDASDLPFYYKLASTFAIADHYHASVLGPTWPNRMYLYAASSYGRTRNVNFTPDQTLFDQLEKRHVDWKVYFSDTGGLGDYLRQLLPRPEVHEATIADYEADAAAGTLPQVAFVCSSFAAKKLSESTWEHQPDVMQVGQKFVAEVISHLAKSPSWSRSALFLTYDEHGGLYDHVPPPPACAPDKNVPEIEPTDPGGGFDQLGFRVPMIVVSPWAKAHYVGHRTYDHTSIVRFIQARFRIPALTGRDANAEAPWDLFDFTKAAHATPPKIELPTVDQAKLADCEATFQPATK